MRKHSLKKRIRLQEKTEGISAYHVKKRGLHIVTSVFRYVFLISFSYVLIYPLFYMIVHSIQGSADFLDPTVQWIPKTFTLDNFKLGIDASEFWDGFKSTVLVQVVSALIEVVSCGVAAYGMSRFTFKGQKLVKGLVILNILVPTTMIIIPSYLNFRNADVLGVLGFIGDLIGKDLTANMLNTPFVFYLPSVFGVGLQSGLLIYIFMQFFKSFPKELEEAAWLDGCTPFNAFFRIVVPSSGVIIMTATIFSVVWHWNEYYLPSMYLSKDYPLAVKVHDIFTLLGNGYAAESVNAAMATCVLFLAPMLIMYLILQKKFIQSITQSGITG